MIRPRPVYSNDGGDRTIYVFPPKNPEFEALDLAAVNRRIREMLPKLKEDLYPLLGRAVIALVPLPRKLGEYMKRAIADLEGIREFFQNSSPVTEEALLSLGSLSGQMLDLVEIFQNLRDRFPRVCDHEQLVRVRTDLQDGGHSHECLPVEPGEEKPARLIKLRATMAKAEQIAARSPGRSFFVYFITRLLRKHGTRGREEALLIAGKLLAAFWSEKDVASKDKSQLEKAHEDGRKVARRSSLATVEDFLECPPAPSDTPEFRAELERKRAALEAYLQASAASGTQTADQLRPLAEYLIGLPGPGTFESLLIWVPIQERNTKASRR